ncbi:TfuA-like protein [Kitasatospora azatica]|uniref:TfuA-like protein n=1 Tax=Kitasatospora azatica TaxID=58347 RepID=UPI00068D37A4|nr:TfuA-like protein [Kitasatospora azatica]
MHGVPQLEDPDLRGVLAGLDRTDLVVFAGPSLVGSPLAELGGHLILPPVRDGDLTAVMGRPDPPAAALVIDGYFGAGQAVNLTEIQAVLRQGVRLYGCSSMGALRAVEARPWGMIGLGAIFLDYLTGSRTSDENVVLMHDDRFRALTVPMVNVDALCTLLESHGVDPARCGAYRRRLGELYFGDRSFSALRVLAKELLSAEGEGSELGLALHYLAPARHAAWDAKRRDAEAAFCDIVLGRAPLQVPTRLVPVPEDVSALLAQE